jgi:hypothetical protein
MPGRYDTHGSSVQNVRQVSIISRFVEWQFRQSLTPRAGVLMIVKSGEQAMVSPDCSCQ